MFCKKETNTMCVENNSIEPALGFKYQECFYPTKREAAQAKLSESLRFFWDQHRSFSFRRLYENPDLMIKLLEEYKKDCS